MHLKDLVVVTRVIQETQTSAEVNYLNIFSLPVQAADNAPAKVGAGAVAAKILEVGCRWSAKKEKMLKMNLRVKTITIGNNKITKMIIRRSRCFYVGREIGGTCWFECIGR